MKKPVPIEVYLAFNCPNQAQDLLMSNGIKPARNRKELVRKLNSYIVDGKENALKQLVEIHPDKDLILAYGTKTETSSSACGCSSADGGASACNCDSCKSKVEGVKAEVEDPNKKMVKVWDSVKPYAPVFIGGGLLLAGLIIFVKRA